MDKLLKIVGVALFNAIVGLLFVFFYGTDLLFSIVVPQIWTLAYIINSRKEEKL